MSPALSPSLHDDKKEDDMERESERQAQGCSLEYQEEYLEHPNQTDFDDHEHEHEHEQEHDHDHENNSDLHSDSGLFRTVITPTTVLSENDNDQNLEHEDADANGDEGAADELLDENEMLLDEHEERVDSGRSADHTTGGDSDNDSHYSEVVQDGVDCLDCSVHGHEHDHDDSAGEAVRVLLRDDSVTK
jgi:hypothetical protein